MEKFYRLLSMLLILATVLSLLPSLSVEATEAEGALVEESPLSARMPATKAVSVSSVSAPDYATASGKKSNWLVMDGGQYFGMGDTGYQSKMQIVTGTTGTELLNYRDKLSGLGYTILYQKAIDAKSGKNRHIKCLAPDGTFCVYAYYREDDKSTRIIVDTNADTFRSYSYTGSGDGSGNGRTELYMIPVSSSVDGFLYSSAYGSQYRNDAGSFQVIKMSDNSLFMIDGGSYNQMSDRDCERVYAFLRRITGLPEGQKLHINTLFFTHYHDDHVSGISRLLYKYNTQFELHNVMYNFDYVGSSGDNMEILAQLYPNAKYYKQHTGEYFTIEGVRFDVLYTVEDRYIPNSNNKLNLITTHDKAVAYSEENNVSSVLKVTFDGKTALLTGDIYDSDKILMAMYPDTFLQTDILQIPHHGFDGHATLAKIVSPSISFINQTESAMGNRKANYNNNRNWAPYAGTIYYVNSETVGYCAQQSVFLRDPYTGVDWLDWGNKTWDITEANPYTGSLVADPEQYYRYTRVTTAPGSISGTFAIVDDKLGYPLSYNTSTGTITNALPAFYSNDTYYFSASQRRSVNWQISASTVVPDYAIISGGKGYYASATVKKGSGDYWGTNSKNPNMALGRDDTYSQSGMFDSWTAFSNLMEPSTNSLRLDMMMDNTFLLYSRHVTGGNTTYQPLYRDPSLTTGKGWGSADLTKSIAAGKADYLNLRLYSYNATPDTMYLQWSGHKDYYLDSGVSLTQLRSLLTADLRVTYSFAGSSGTGEIFHDGWRYSQESGSSYYQTTTPGTYYLELPGSISSAGTYVVNIKYLNASGTVITLGSVNVHIANRNSKAETKQLYFDFNDNTEARRKYQYGGQYSYTNFDGSSRWQFIEYDRDTGKNNSTNGFVDTLSGTLKLYTKATTTTGKNLSVRSFANTRSNEYANGTNPLNYSPANAEILQIRFKMEDLKAADGNSFTFTLAYQKDGSTTTQYDTYHDLSNAIASAGTYVTHTFDLSQAFRNSSKITSIRPAFCSIVAANPSVPGCVTIDYIYIGPRADAPQPEPDYLLFDFHNYTEDQSRYTQEVYNSLAFDRENQGNWATSETSTTAKVYNEYSISNKDGTLTVKVAEGASYNTDNGYYGPWVVTAAVPGVFSSRDQREFHALGYEPKVGDHIRIRFKVEGCISATGTDPRVVVIYDRMVDGVTDRGSYNLIDSYPLHNGVYQTIDIPVNSGFYSADAITTLGFRFWDLIAQAPGSGRVVIDYIYVGPPDSIPPMKRIVTFAQDDGSQLYQTTVSAGSAVVYGGPSLHKAPDRIYHYNLTHWVDATGRTVDLNNIQDSITLYPRYTEELHSYRNGFCTVCGMETRLVADVQAVVLDYGKAIDVSVVQNAQVSGASELLVRDGQLKSVAFVTASDSSYGILDLLDKNGDGKHESLRFTPTAMLDKAVTVDCSMEISTEDGNTLQVSVPVTFLPATSVYYESDFADGIFQLESTGTTDAENQWVSPDTPSTHPLQDQGTVGNHLYDFVIDRGSIPSNAFFADFDNTGVGTRYRVDNVYRWLDYDNITTWLAFSSGASKLEMKHEESALVMSFSDATNTNHQYHYAQTVYPGAASLDTPGPLLIKPNEDHYIQLRFKLENCILYSTANAYIAVCFSKENENFCNRTSGNFAYLPLTEEQVLSEEYITLTYSLKNLTHYTQSLFVDAIQYQIGNVKAAPNKEGKFILDYIYIGPITDNGSAQGQQYTNNNAKDGLFFDFRNDHTAVQRYSLPRYNGLNFDTGTYWTTSYSTSTASNPTGANYTSPGINVSSNGFLNIPINSNYNTSGTSKRYGPYLYITKNRGTISGLSADYQANYPLNYTAPSGPLNYFVRFKISGCKFNYGTHTGNVNAYVQFTLIGQTATGAYVNKDADMSYKIGDYNGTGKFVELGVDARALMDSVGMTTIRAIYLRFANIEKSGSASGLVEVDYIYLGQAESHAQVQQLQENVLWFDFTNNEFDKLRYSGSIYGGKNYDAFDAWSVDTNCTTLSRIGNGVLVMSDATPRPNSTEGANGNLYTSTSVNGSRNLNYIPTANDFCQIRMRIDGGTKDSASTPGFRIDFWGSNYGTAQNASPTVNFDWDRYVNKGYFTLNIPMNTSNYLNAGRITAFHPVVIGTQGATVTIDYIYIGPMKNAAPPLDSLFFGFDGLKTDQIRYSSDDYDNRNYDAGNWATQSGYSSGTHAYSIDTEIGILSLEVTDKFPAADSIRGPYLFTTNQVDLYPTAPSPNALYYTPRNAEYLQVRFRTVNCEVVEGNTPNALFLFRGYDKNGNVIDYNTDRLKPDMSGIFKADEEYQTITIPLSDAFRSLKKITHIGLHFQHIVSTAAGSVDIDYIYIGTGRLAPDPVYGYDSGYTDDTTFSDGDSHFVKGSGIKLPDGTYDGAYTQATFTFKGTGFDLISRTGKDQATIRVYVFTDPQMTSDSLIKSVSINLKGEQELHQIPAVSVRDLPHGTYYVAIGVNSALNYTNPLYAVLNRGNEFYLDAIRIYDPICVDQAVLSSTEKQALEAYRTHKEAYANIKEFRDSLITAAEAGTATIGSLFVDTKSSNDYQTENGVIINNHLAVSIGTYAQVGPKNEVYLSPGEAIAFKLSLDSTQWPVSIDIGAKTVLENSGNAVLAAGFVGTSSIDAGTLNTLTRLETDLHSATAMYYPLDLSKLPNNSNVYLVIYNAYNGTDKTKHILSLTDLKVAYDQAPDTEVPAAKNPSSPSPYSFRVDERTLEAAATFIGALLKDSLPEEALQLNHSLNLAGDISINYMVPIGKLENCTDIRLELQIPNYHGDSNGFHDSLTLEPVVKDGYYYFTLSELTAVQMNDEIEAVLYWTRDGKDYRSTADVYSIAQYAYRQLRKEGSADKLKTLCVNLLVYGAKAQIFKNYRPDSLADSLLTSGERTYVTNPETVTFGSCNQLLKDCETASVTWIGKSLNLGTKVGLRFMVDSTDYEGAVEDLSLHISYTNFRGENKTAVITEKTPLPGRDNAYVFAFDALDAAELRSVLTVVVYAGNTQVSHSLIYSADTYGTGKTGALGDVCKALFAYSDSARTFFQ